MAASMAFETVSQNVNAGATMVCPGGSTFLLRVAQSGCNITFMKAGRSIGRAQNVRQGFGWESPEPFDTVVIVSTQQQQVTADVATGRVLANGVTGNVESTRVQATGISPEAVYTVGTAAVQVNAGQSGVRQIVITNIGTTTIYLGGSGVSANSPIALAAGARYVDANAAQANWYALSSAAGGSVSVITMS